MLPGKDVELERIEFRNDGWIEISPQTPRLKGTASPNGRKINHCNSVRPQDNYDIQAVVFLRLSISNQIAGVLENAKRRE
jgi:hypothetical protein